jgi:hypothetical protein
MKRLILSYVALLMFVSIFTLLTAAVRAELDTPFTLTWNAVVTGGVSSGGSYTLADAVGQPVAGASSGGNYTLVDGFYSGEGGGAPAEIKVYLPMTVR